MKEIKTKAQFDQIITALSLIMDQFGEHNLLHSRRVAVIAAALSEIVMPGKRDLIFYAGMIHDIGAVIFGEHPMMFPTMEEQKRVPCIVEHPTVGSKIIAKLNVPEEVRAYIQDHHEWYDGSGYPNGKKGDDISMGAQLIRIADTINLKRQYPTTDLYNHLRLHKGREFSPELWNAILDLKNKDAGVFLIEIFDTRGMRRVFSEVLRSVNPVWVASSAMVGDYMKIILPLFAEIVDAKYGYTTKHSGRVAFFGEKIARIMELPQTEIDHITYAAYLHDIGKCYVPHEILNKTGHLSDREVEIVKRYPIITMEILDTIEAFRDFTAIVGFHQERYDGKGYPDGLSGEDIPIGARILGVADSVVAMLSDRPYRGALSLENTVIQLQRYSGTQFDPMVAYAAIGLLNNKEILEEMQRISTQ